MVTESRRIDSRVKRVVQVLNQNPSRRLPELAQNCQISTSRLSHLFKNEIGINVKGYCLDRRLQAAAELILAGRPIKEIAYIVGYSHSSSFVRAFKIHFGLSPVCYRRARLEQTAQQYLLTDSQTG
jgi:AraC family transcriptional regulator of arabinose operon